MINSNNDKRFLQRSKKLIFKYPFKIQERSIEEERFSRRVSKFKKQFFLLQKNIQKVWIYCLLKKIKNIIRSSHLQLKENLECLHKSNLIQDHPVVIIYIIYLYQKNRYNIQHKFKSYREKMSAASAIAKIIKDTKQKPNQIEQLVFQQILIPSFTPEIKQTLEKCTKLKRFTFSKSGLVSLDNFPKFPELIFLDLEGNKLTDKAFETISQYENLIQLFLQRNKIQNLEAIQSITDLKQLQQIQLSENPITSVQNYRTKVFDLFPSLLILDGFDKDGNPQVEDQEEGEEDSEQYQQEQAEEEDTPYSEEQYSSEEKPKKKRK